jgi:hypothetical protein
LKRILLSAHPNEKKAEGVLKSPQRVFDSSVRLKFEKVLVVWRMRLISSGEKKDRPDDSTICLIMGLPCIASLYRMRDGEECLAKKCRHCENFLAEVRNAGKGNLQKKDQAKETAGRTVGNNGEMG